MWRKGEAVSRYLPLQPPLRVGNDHVTGLPLLWLQSAELQRHQGRDLPLDQSMTCLSHELFLFVRGRLLVLGTAVTFCLRARIFEQPPKLFEYTKRPWSIKEAFRKSVVCLVGMRCDPGNGDFNRRGHRSH